MLCEKIYTLIRIRKKYLFLPTISCEVSVLTEPTHFLHSTLYVRTMHGTAQLVRKDSKTHSLMMVSGSTVGGNLSISDYSYCCTALLLKWKGIHRQYYTKCSCSSNEINSTHTCCLHIKLHTRVLMRSETNSE